MKPKSVDNFILFNIFGRKIKKSKLLILVGISCKQGNSMLNWTEKMDEVEVRAVIKYFCKKGMSLKEVHDNFIKILWDESPYSMVEKWAAEFRRWRDSMED